MEIPRKIVAMGTALAFTLSGCSADFLWSDRHPDAHVSADANSQNSAEAVRKLIGSGAAVNVIDIPISAENKAEDTSAEKDTEGEKFVADLQSPKSTFRTALTKAFAKATFGRYTPEVNYTRTKPFELKDGCIDMWTTGSLKSLNAFIEKAKKPDQLNIAVVEAHTCEPPEGQQGAAGFLIPRGFPVVTKLSIKDAANVAVHEAGHYAGNPHAGIAECEDVTHIQGCTVNGTADYWSLMSWDDRTNKFTVPELYKMGLLRPDEVVDLRNSSVDGQEVTLTDMSHKQGVKLIIARTAIGGEIYLSWSKDINAGYRDKCVRTKTEFGTPKGAEDEDTLWGFEYTVPGSNKIKYYRCYDIDKTKQNHSLQMRVEGKSVNEGTDAAYGGDSFVLVVPSAERVKGTKDEFINKRRSFMDPPESVYAAGTMPITYVSADHREAVVKIG